MDTQRILEGLNATRAIEKAYGMDQVGVIASTAELRAFMQDIKAVMFPGIYLKDRSLESRLFNISDFVSRNSSQKCADAFVSQLPQIKRLLLTDVDAVSHNDPAVTNHLEIIICYPSIKVMTYYRTAHALLQAGVKLLPRMLTEIAHGDTGIDIHPAAKIDEYFAIDHGTGVVIGETCIIGKHVMLYQGVTLGAKNFQYSEDGTPLDIPRHPIIEDNVTVYSNTSILGRITIGHDTIIGGNIWLANDVPPYSKITQSKAVYNDRV